MHSALFSDARTGARSLVGENQPAEVARSRQARNTRRLLTAESGVRGETRFLGQLRQSVRSGSARMPLSGHESEGVRFRCRQVRIQPPALPASGGFFLRSPERITPHFFVTCSLRALHLSLLELENALLERVFSSTLFLSECRCLAVSYLTGTNCGSK